MKKIFEDTLNTVKAKFKKNDLLGPEFLKAAAISNMNGLKMLLSKEADPNYQNTANLKTALHLAVEKNDLPLVEFLLLAGASGALKDSTQNTPLLFAVEKNLQKIIKTLCGNPATSGIKELNFAGETVVNVALRIQQIKVALFLLDHGADPDASLRRALVSNDESQIGWLCGHGANPNIADPAGVSPLSRAAQDGDVKKMAKWIAWGADINYKGGNGHLVRTKDWTPLMIAIEHGRREASAFLLARPNIDFAYATHGGVTASTLAISKGDFESVEKLKAKGAKLPEKLSDGTTPLMLAANSGNSNLVQFVLDWQSQK
ncbi:MAG: ankyrin repeat domain-containing protein [Bdellovibrionia bacterium]